jgi:hypothetical protein
MIRLRIEIVISALLAAVPSLPAFGACGGERWNIKTGTDPEAYLISTNRPTRTTIAEMKKWAKPEEGEAGQRKSPQELTAYRFKGKIVSGRKDADGTYLLEIRDSAGRKIAAEIPDPKCVGPQSPFASMIKESWQKAESRFGTEEKTKKKRKRHRKIRISATLTGVPLFDEKGGVEIAPLLDLEF